MSTSRTDPYTEEAYCYATLSGSSKRSDSSPTSSQQPSFLLSYALTRPTSDPPTRLALLAHPWGRLGGSKDDHVVVGVTNALVGEGYAVCRYDARGAGGSVGVGATWTGLAETADFSHLVQTVLLPLLPPHHPSSIPVDLLLIGYSYGSLAAASAPPLTEVPHGLTLRTRAILISYPCSVLSFLTFFKSSHYTQTLLESIQKYYRPTLVIWGTRDQFTAVGKYEAWFKRIQGADLARLTERVQVEGADHFWRQQEDKQRLIQSIVEWVRR